MINCYILDNSYTTRLVSSFQKMAPHLITELCSDMLMVPKTEVIKVCNNPLDKNKLTDPFNDINDQIIKILGKKNSYNTINNAIFMSDDRSIDSVLFDSIVRKGVEIYFFLQIDNNKNDKDKYKLLCYLFNDENNKKISEITMLGIKYNFMNSLNDSYNFLNDLDINHEFYDNKDKREILQFIRSINYSTFEEYFGNI